MSGILRSRLSLLPLDLFKVTAVTLLKTFEDEVNLKGIWIKSEEL